MTISDKQILECELWEATRRKDFLTRLHEETKDKHALSKDEEKTLQDAVDNFKAKEKALKDYESVNEKKD